MPTQDFSPKVANAVGFGPNIAVQAQAFGAVAVNTMRANAPSGDSSIQPAGLFSTAPYRGPTVAGKSVSLVKIEAIREDVGERDDRYGKCFGNNDTCTAWGTKKYDGLCNAHGRSALGLSAYSPKGG